MRIFNHLLQLFPNSCHCQMAALEGGEYAFGGDGVKTSESGAALQVSKRHRE